MSLIYLQGEVNGKSMVAENHNKDMDGTEGDTEDEAEVTYATNSERRKGGVELTESVF